MSIKEWLATAAMLAVLLPGTSSFGAEKPIGAPVSAERLKMGERMYRQGILPSGKPMPAYVKGDIPVPGTAFSCANCHLRSGLGSSEGGVFTPPATARSLFAPPKAINATKYGQLKPPRPVYTDRTLADMLRGGIDPSGRQLDLVMPRYRLDDQEMGIMIDYLRSLSATFSPGVSESTVRFAMVVTDDAPKRSAEILYSALQRYIGHKNNMALSYEKEPRRSRMAEAMLISREAAFKRIELTKWQLTGPPQTWRTQLDRFYREQPVFALLGGISASNWAPIHQFSEDNAIPCILPWTELPVVSDSDWYTLYFSKGAYLEGASAASFIHDQLPPAGEPTVIQITGDSPRGRALQAGFDQAWQEKGHPAASALTVKPDERFASSLKAVPPANRPVFLVLWAAPEKLHELAEITTADKNGLRLVVSSDCLGNAATALKESLRERVYVTYPYRLPADELPFGVYVDAMIQSMQIRDEAEKEAVKRAYIIYQVLSRALSELKGLYTRDALLDVIGMAPMGSMGVNPDLTFPLYDRFSFGPGQRYASKGCHIVKLGKGPKPVPVPVGDWIFH